MLYKLNRAGFPAIGVNYLRRKLVLESVLVVTMLCMVMHYKRLCLEEPQV
jgi:hypothetical protein